MILTLLLYALFASVFVVSKVCLHHSQPLFFVGSRMLVAGVLLLAWQVLVRKEKLGYSKRVLWRLLALGVFNIYLTNAAEAWGLQHLTSFKTCFIYSLSPFLSALLSYFIFKEKLTRNKWLGLLVGCMGFAPILLAQTQAEQSVGSLWLFSWPELSVLLAVFSSVYGWILLRQLVREGNVSPLTANGVAMLIGGMIALINSGLVENWNPVPVHGLGTFMGCTLILIVISNFVCYNLYGYLLKRLSAPFMSFAGFSTPFFTALFGWLYLGEVVTWPFWISAGVVLVGLGLFYLDEAKQGLQSRAKTTD